MPFAIVELQPARHADENVLFADLHEGESVPQGQNEPVLPVFGVSIEDRSFGVKGPKLKGRLDAEETEKFKLGEQTFKKDLLIVTANTEPG